MPDCIRGHKLWRPVSWVKWWWCHSCKEQYWEEETGHPIPDKAVEARVLEYRRRWVERRG